MAAVQVAPGASHGESVREAHPSANEDAAPVALSGKPLATAASPLNLYHHLFGQDFLVAPAPPRKTPPSPSRAPRTPSRRYTAVPSTPPSASSGTKRTASEALSEAADAPQLGSSHRAGSRSMDLHNHPTPTQLLREQRHARHETYAPSPKRARNEPAMPSGSCRFPVSPGRTPRPTSAASFPYNVGMTPRTALTSRHPPFSRPGHARMASMPESHRDHYVPVRSYDPVPSHVASSDAALMRPWHGAPRGFQAIRSHVRAASSDISAPLSRTHRRSVSHGAMDSNTITPRPISHDRSSSMKTPPSGDSALPVTPKTMHGSLSYGEFLNISPSPQPRGGLRVRGAPDVLPLSPPFGPTASPSRTADRPSHFTAPRGARPLWAQPSQREVYRCLDTETKNTVAAKIVNLELSTQELLTVQKEIHMLQQVRHPCITACYDSFVEGSDLWIIMEYCSGGSCSDLVRAHTLQERHIAIILREVLQALVYIHADKKIHRDIKAANILLHKDGTVRLADFGVAGQLHAQAKRVNSFVGTPYWMGPEVVKQSGYTTNADIWSVGITAIELAQGEPPYAALHPMKVLHLIPRNPPPQLPKSYTSTFRDFVAKCLTRDPLQRPSAAQLLKHPFIRKAGSTKQLAPLAVARPLKKREPKHTDTHVPSEAPLWDFASLRPSMVEPREAATDCASASASASPAPAPGPRVPLWKQTYRTLLGRGAMEPTGTQTSRVVQYDTRLA